jgi:alcohol dehydrogenase class IV
MHHGLANALCLVAGMKFCAARKPGVYRRVGAACGLELGGVSDAMADAATIRFITGVLSDLDLDTRLQSHGVKRDQLEALVVQAVDDPCHKTNVVPVDAADFRRLYLEVL